MLTVTVLYLHACMHKLRCAALHCTTCIHVYVCVCTCTCTVTVHCILYTVGDVSSRVCAVGFESFRGHRTIIAHSQEAVSYIV